MMASAIDRPCISLSQGLYKRKKAWRSIMALIVSVYDEVTAADGTKFCTFRSTTPNIALLFSVAPRC